MHIILGIIAIITAISVWYWRMQQVKGAAEELGKVAETAANLPRKLAFRYKSGKNGLALIEDPREAAAIMMMEVARARGEVTLSQKDVIAEEIMRHFEFTAGEADDLVTHAGWVSRDTPIPHAVMEKMSKLIVNSPALGPRQIVDMDGMLVAVSEADGLPTPEQMDLIQIFRNKAGLKT